MASFLSKEPLGVGEATRAGLSCLYIAIKLLGDFSPGLINVDQYRRIQMKFSNAELAKTEMRILKEAKCGIFMLPSFFDFLMALKEILRPVINLTEF